ncbi:hydantoinase B/oxoprolinase family protein [Microbacterium pygmaeum]|uniref:N-methylhydantoinase B n=1 Tax=Microbacterium pygmaeum TaxID=370764 RepID=A0A1G7XCN2_9MICO|nr:hydantoinase B/oxoprolinase family protein [Microbacterium pygmaeum]SDG81988.1 N-methylhydantoinase B [Microbacterium pygmaeum]
MTDTLIRDDATSSSAPTIRELTDRQFTERYGCDRFTASIIVHRLHYVVEHMSTGFLREAFSPIIRDWYDFACTVSGPPEDGYPMSVVSDGLPVFSGTMADAVRNSIDEYGPENLQEGDVLIANDPYRVGTHVNDVCFIRPIFVDGRPVSFVTLRAHQMDIGGVVPGGFSAIKKDVYENGLVIPPMLLWSRGVPVRSTFSLIFDNSRFGELLLPDFMSINQQLKLGESLIREDIARYGLGAYSGALKYACDVSAERMAAAIAQLPDGDYTGSGLIDADGQDDTLEFPVQVTIRKRGDRIEADLSGTSEQARTSINAGILDAKAAIGVALTLLLDSKTPFTSGTWRNIDIVAPEGTLLSALPPEGPTMLFWEASAALGTAVFEALNPVLGTRGVAGDYGSTNNHTAFGRTADGKKWTRAGLLGAGSGPRGGTEIGDGDSCTTLFTLNTMDPAVEAIEHDAPVVVLRKDRLIDTGGAGVHRGGAAAIKDTLYMTDAEHYSNPSRTKIPSGVGANGGAAGPNGAVWIFPPEESAAGARGRRTGLVDLGGDVYRATTPVAGVLDPESKRLDPEDGVYFYRASQPIWHTRAGAVFRYLTNGGGGWGDPALRDPEAVLKDVRDEYVSVEAAAATYGVVVIGDPATDPEGLSIDQAATAALRSATT